MPVTAVGSWGGSGHTLRFVPLETDINGRCRLTGRYNRAGISQLTRSGVGLVDPALPLRQRKLGSVFVICVDKVKLGNGRFRLQESLFCNGQGKAEDNIFA
jgi:hypothetical protein